MRKAIWLLLLVLCLGSLPVKAEATPPLTTIKIEYIPLTYFYDQVQKTPPPDKTGFIYNGTTYVPLRWLCESLGKDVTWDEDTYTIRIGDKDITPPKQAYPNSEFPGTAPIKSGNIEVAFIPLNYFFGGEQKTPPADKTGFIYNSTTYVPLRWLCESLGKDVTWDGYTYAIWIGTHPNVTGDRLSTFWELPLPSGGELFTPWYFKENVTIAGRPFGEAYLTTVNDKDWSGKRWMTMRVLGRYEYTKLQVWIGLDASKMKRDASATFYFIASDKLVHKVTKSRNDRPSLVTIDITGHADFEIEISGDESGNNAYAFFADPILIK